jgi:hypothetical protein
MMITDNLPDIGSVNLVLVYVKGLQVTQVAIDMRPVIAEKR